MLRQTVERVLAYTPEQLFDLVADVERYPDFLPWWTSARIGKREEAAYCTDQVVRFWIVRRRFRSRTVLERPNRIEVASTDRLFRRFTIRWAFEPAPGSSCRVRLSVDLALRSRHLQTLADIAFGDAAGQMISAFEDRARRVYGPSSDRGIDV